MNKINENMPIYFNKLNEARISYTPKFNEIDDFFDTLQSNKLKISKEENFDYKHAIHSIYFKHLTASDKTNKQTLIGF